MKESGNRQLAINLVANVLSYGTTLIVTFFLTPYLIKVLGKEAYSFYPMANNFVSYISVVTVALNSMGSRFITIELAKNNYQKANIYFSSIFFSNVMLSALLLVPMTAIVVFLDRLLHIPADLILTVKLLFALTFISMVVSVLTSVFGIAVFAKNRLELKSLVDIIVAVLRVALFVFLFICFKPTIVFVGIVGLFLAVFTFIMQYIYTRRLLPDIHISTAYFDLKSVKEVLASGIWNSVSSLGAILIGSTSLLVSNLLIGVEASGDISIVQTIPNFINGVIGMLTSVFMPAITITYATKKKKDVINEVKKAQNIMGLFCNIPIMVFVACSVNFFNLWTPGQDSVLLSKLSFLAIGHLLLIAALWPAYNLNTVTNHVKFPAIAILLSGVLNICLMLVFVKIFNLGLYGILLAQFITNSLSSIVAVGIYPAMCLGERWYIFWGAVLKTFLSALLIYIIATIINQAFWPESWLMLVAECVVCGIIGLIINGLMLLKPNGIKRMHTKYFEKHK